MSPSRAGQRHLAVSTSAMPPVKPEVTLVKYTPDPIESLYTAYRVCYSKDTPQEIYERIRSEKISPKRMETFVEEKLQLGHTSPLQHVEFEFGISGVSRSFSHQFVRHHVGISFEQQSQRYVEFKNGDFPFVVPPSIDFPDSIPLALFLKEMYVIAVKYGQMIEDGVPPEDARFILPNATATNFKVKVNFLELKHICSIRLCTQAQWEFRKVMSLMRAEVNKAVPELGKHLGIKCQSMNLGYCDESLKAYKECPVGKQVPHKTDVLKKNSYE